MADKQKKPVVRDSAGRFVKGCSGNPGGRPRIPEDVREMLRAATVEAAQLLIDSLSDETVSYNLRLDAAKTIFDRVLGKVRSQAAEEESEAKTVQFVLAPELEEYAE